MNIWKCTKVYTASLFMAMHFGKRALKTLLESNVLNCCLKITTADLRKIGLKIRELRFKELSS